MTDNEIAARITELSIVRARAYMMTSTHTDEANSFIFHLLDAVHNIPLWIASGEPALDLFLRATDAKPENVKQWIRETYAELLRYS